MWLEGSYTKAFDGFFSQLLVRRPGFCAALFSMESLVVATLDGLSLTSRSIFTRTKGFKKRLERSESGILLYERSSRCLVKGDHLPYVGETI